MARPHEPQHSDRFRSVRVPNWLADYECQRSLVCCHDPWKASLKIGETRRIRDVLEAMPRVRSRFHAALVRPQGAVRREVIRTSGRCVLLDEPRDCALQAAGGLSALPSACRDFPRRMARTPEGVECIYTMACPTVASKLLMAEGRFEWVSPALPDWPYEPSRTISEPLWVTEAESITYRQLCEMRSRWWDALHASSPEGLFRLLGSLSSGAASPDDVGPLPADLNHPGFSRDVAVEISARFRSLPNTSVSQSGVEALLTRLQRPHAAEALQPALSEKTGVFQAIASLRIASAGVHEKRPVAHGLALAARQTALAAMLYLDVMKSQEAGSESALRDAMVVAAHLCAGRPRESSGTRSLA